MNNFPFLNKFNMNNAKDFSEEIQTKLDNLCYKKSTTPVGVAYKKAVYDVCYIGIIVKEPEYKVEIIGAPSFKLPESSYSDFVKALTKELKALEKIFVSKTTKEKE